MVWVTVGGRIIYFLTAEKKGFGCYDGSDAG